MTEKSKREIDEFIKTYSRFEINERCYEAFEKLSKTVRARENGSIKTQRKSEASLKNGRSGGRPVEYVSITLLDEETNLIQISVEKTNKDTALLSEIYDYEKNTGLKVIDHFEC